MDDVYPDQLPTEKLVELDGLYREFYLTTKCESLILHTDDMNLNRQISDIKQFLFLEEKYSEFS